MSELFNVTEQKILLKTLKAFREQITEDKFVACNRKLVDLCEDSTELVKGLTARLVEVESSGILLNESELANVFFQCVNPDWTRRDDRTIGACVRMMKTAIIENNKRIV